MKRGKFVRCFVVGLGVMSATLLTGFVQNSEARDVPGLQQIQRGAWQESTPMKSYTVYRNLCIDKLQFLTMEGYAWGQSSSTSSHMIQVMDANGKPKTCQ